MTAPRQRIGYRRNGRVYHRIPYSVIRDHLPKGRPFLPEEATACVVKAVRFAGYGYGWNGNIYQLMNGLIRQGRACKSKQRIPGKGVRLVYRCF